jgi:hypothetical protein
MRVIFEFAEFLACAWRLAAAENDKIPTSHGILDQALFDLRDELPKQFHDELTFGNTRVGFRCYELPDVLYAAQANLLTSEPNPTYLSTSVQIDDSTARRLLMRRHISPDVARDFGRRLKERAATIKAQNANAA